MPQLRATSTTMTRANQSLGANGLPMDASACKDAVNLHNLDDWKEFKRTPV